MKIYNLPLEDRALIGAKFKPLCPDNMKLYIDHLRRHHKYSTERLLEVFPEYLDRV